jgi:hypothetical protein
VTVLLPVPETQLSSAGLGIVCQSTQKVQELAQPRQVVAVEEPLLLLSLLALALRNLVCLLAGCILDAFSEFS